MMARLKQGGAKYFSKTFFDKGPDRRLIAKLDYYGIRGNMIMAIEACPQIQPYHYQCLQNYNRGCKASIFFTFRPVTFCVLHSTMSENTLT